MKRFSVLLVALMALFYADAASAACVGGTRWWVPGGNGNWSSTTNWSTSSGGASGAAVPTHADFVCFDANSGTGVSTVDRWFQVNSIDFTSGGASNFTGTLTILAAPLSYLGYLGKVTVSAGMTVLRPKNF
jgi:hypothetical protein